MTFSVMRWVGISEWDVKIGRLLFLPEALQTELRLPQNMSYQSYRFPEPQIQKNAHMIIALFLLCVGPQSLLLWSG